MLTQFASLSLADQKKMLVSLRDFYNSNRASAKLTRQAAAEARAKAKADKQAAAIVKAQARLQKLLDKQNPVGAKAIKAAKRPSKVTVTYGAEDSIIASRIMAKKSIIK